MVTGTFAEPVAQSTAGTIKNFTRNNDEKMNVYGCETQLNGQPKMQGAEPTNSV